jgi:hippurate hydrolase
MPVINRIAAYAGELAEWRRHLHRNPELGFDCHATAAFVAGKLRAFGVDAVHEGIAESGVVAVIEGRAEGPAVALRADMDALPIDEMTGRPHASLVPGRMHACGHDGHTAILLGAARYLAETRNFAGRAVLIFQPAEEHGGGAGVMVEAGVLDTFGVREVYALHNAPGMEPGTFATAPGPFMAAVDTFEIHVTGKGGHGAMPHDAIDPIMSAVAIVQGLQTIVSRNNCNQDDLVLSVTQIHAGTADNIIPGGAYICGTVRTFLPRVRDLVRARMTEIVTGTAMAFEVRAALDYQIGYPATVNDEGRAAFAAAVAREISGDAAVDATADREMGAEDFAYMLNARPGAYLFLGQGDGPGLHHPRYDYNDEITPVGASFFARLIERALPVGSA